MTSILDQISPETIDTIQIDPEKDYFTELVGENNKYKTQQDLARATVEKELLIQRQRRENQELREDFVQRGKDLEAARATKRLEDMLDQLQRQGTVPTIPSENNQTNKGTNGSPQTLTPEDIETILQRRDEKTRKEANQKEVVRKLTETYGGNYVSKIKETATQLNVEVEFLDNLAVTNPQAFYKIMDMDKPKVIESDISIPPRNRMNTTSELPNTGRKNFAHYEKMRKSEPERYHSIQIQNEMHKEALRQLEAFYT